MVTSPSMDELLSLPNEEKIKRFDAMARGTFSHVDGRDLLHELHPRRQLDIKRRVDAHETWFEGDWLTNLWRARNGGHGWGATRPDYQPLDADALRASGASCGDELERSAT